MKKVSEHLAAVVELLDLDTTDSFTKAMACMFAFQDAHTETKEALVRCQDKVHELEGKVIEMHGHLLNFSKSLGASEGMDMLELLYEHFSRIVCTNCGHPADEHFAESGCAVPCPINGFCDCTTFKASEP